MTSFSSVRQYARTLVDQLPEANLQQAVKVLEMLKTKPQTDAPTINETDLLNIITWILPTEDQTRLSYLRQCNEAATITTDEHQELLTYVEQLEQHDAQRADALIKLAQLRQVDLDVVLQEFLPAHVS